MSVREGACCIHNQVCRKAVCFNNAQCSDFMSILTIQKEVKKRLDKELFQILDLLEEDLNVYKMPEGDFGFTNGQISSDGLQTYGDAENKALCCIIANVKNYIEAILKNEIEYK